LTVTTLVANGTTQGVPDAAVASAEFPSRDGWALAPLRSGEGAAALRRAQAADPTSPEALRRLLSNRISAIGGAGDRDFAQTLQVLTKAFDGPASAVVPKIEVIAGVLRVSGQTDRELAASTLGPVIARLDRALDAWPAEEAARAAKALMRIESTLSLVPRDQWRPRMRAVATRFPGTLTSQLIEVDLLIPDNTRTLEQIRLYDAYWRSHPGTAAGAYALLQKGFQLHVNVPVTGAEPRGSDPTPRLLEVAAIVKELETGPYPDGEWRKKAPELITGFFVSSEPPPAYLPGNVDRAIAVYADFVRARFGTSDQWGLDSSLTYVIETKMGDLYERKGDRTAGVAGFYADLEKTGANPTLAKLARGLFLLQRGPQQIESRARGRVVLAELMADGRRPEARRAAAELALAALEDGDRASALAQMEAFVARWADAPWAWLAHLRQGQLHYDSAAWTQAAAAFRAAARVGAHPPAAVIGFTLAARSLEAGQQFAEARDAYRQARQAFDPAYMFGSTYRWDVVLPDGAHSLKAFATITPEMLDSRATQLTLALSKPNGDRHARAAWLLESGRLDEARASATGDRDLEHEIDFERALAATDATKAVRDDAAALKILSALRGPITDGAMFAGQVAQSALEFRQGREDIARGTLTAALRDWLRLQQSRVATRRDAVDDDVVAIRQLLFRPLGDLAPYAEGWNAFKFPATLPPFQIVQADVVVTLAGQSQATRTVWQIFPDLPNALLLESTDLARLSRVLNVVGGTDRRAPQNPMETPNQPIGTARDIAAFWNTLFATRPGHWGGWVLDTFPQVTRITFTDAARTKALAAVTVGYSGGVVVLEKEAGRWIARRLIDRWIT
jgi:tetratricopeptide (TPR) repeat protein